MTEPAKNSITHLCCLITGDRFYCWTDQTKKVWQLRMHTSIMFKGEFKKFSHCVDDSGKSTRFDANRVVMFLRRTKPLVKRKKSFDIERYFA